MKISIPALSAAAVLVLSAAFAPPSGDVDALIAAYRQAQTEWQVQMKQADTSARRELRANPPALAFWERFDAAAEAGEGRALLWMATHLRDKGLKSKDLREQKPVLYGKLVSRHAAEAWFGDVLKQLPREKRYVEETLLASFYETTIEKNQAADVRAQAMYRLGALLLDSDDEAGKQQGRAWLEKAIELAPDSDYGMMARSELYKPVVGELAPDFKGRTIDGYEFNLSDYRGKVVLLDFYGFW